MNDSELQSHIDALHKALADNATEMERIRQLIAYQKKQIKKYEAEQERRKRWAEKNSLSE